MLCQVSLKAQSPQISHEAFHPLRDAQTVLYQTQLIKRLPLLRPCKENTDSEILIRRFNARKHARSKHDLMRDLKSRDDYFGRHVKIAKTAVILCSIRFV